MSLKEFLILFAIAATILAGAVFLFGKDVSADDAFKEWTLYGLGTGSQYVPVPLPYHIYLDLVPSISQPLSRYPILKLPRQEGFLFVPHSGHSAAIYGIYQNPFEYGFGLYPPYFIPVPIE